MRRLIAFFALAAALSASAARGEEGEKKEEKPAAPVFTGPSDHYVHNWIAAPAVTGVALGGGDGEITVTPRKGRVTLVVFLASWCEACQQMAPDFLALMKRYQRLDTDVVYVFAHDTKGDAEGFMKEFGIDEGVLGNLEILKTFHNPELPTVYVVDRNGWLATRYTKAGPGDLAKLDDFLKLATAF
jgi:thiol-disulfide isomerase/thioredoxin